MVSSAPAAVMEAMVLFTAMMLVLLAAILPATVAALSRFAMVVVPPKVLSDPAELAVPTSVNF